jgi:hypothetical protein
VANLVIESQITQFYDETGTGAFFATPFGAPHTILRLKDGMDNTEPSTNGTSASNLYRLSSLLNDDTYSAKARQTIAAFESEILQYPWLFPSFMPSIVASKLGVRGIVVAQGNEKDDNGVMKVKDFEKAPRGGLGTFARINSSEEQTWLRERNSLLGSFGRDGRTRIIICDGGRCVEEGVLQEVVPEMKEKGAVPEPPTAIVEESQPPTTSNLPGEPIVLNEVGMAGDDPEKIDAMAEKVDEKVASVDLGTLVQNVSLSDASTTLDSTKAVELQSASVTPTHAGNSQASIAPVEPELKKL